MSWALACVAVLYMALARSLWLQRRKWARYARIWDMRRVRAREDFCWAHRGADLEVAMLATMARYQARLAELATLPCTCGGKGICVRCNLEDLERPVLEVVR